MEPLAINNEIRDICNRYGIADMYVFGSRAGEIAELLTGVIGKLSPSASDLDIGVLPETIDSLNLEKKTRLAIELEDLFQVDRVDVVQLRETDPYLALEIIRGELIYTGDPDQQARHELYVLRRAEDLLPFKKERTRLILREGAR